MTTVRRLMALFWLALAADHMSANQRLTIAVFDYAGLPRGEVTSAIKIAARVLNAAGIDADWPNCNFVHGALSECTQRLPDGAQYLAVLVMPKMLVHSSRVEEGADLAGYALTGEGALPRAWVFYDAVWAFAQRSRRHVALVLGCILIHEIAHILGLDHRAGGIMQPNLHPSDIDEAICGRVFTASQVKSLQAGASRVYSWLALAADGPGARLGARATDSPAR